MPNGSNKLLSGVYRISDYLDKQAIREKEKKKEKFLQVLPTYLEQQISGIEDEKTLLSTIPKLSAQLYQYGAEVGSAANQILGNLAQTKYKELALTKQDKQLSDTLGIYGETFKGVTFDFGGNPNATMGDVLNDLRGKGYDSQTIGSQIGNILKATAFEKTGEVSEKNGRTYYNEYSISPKGTMKAGTSFQINEDTQGKRTMDILGTEEVEQRPITPEVLEYYGEKNKYDRQLQKQFGLMVQRDKIAEQRATDRYIKSIEKGQYYDRETKEPIFATVDPNTLRPQFYKERQDDPVSSVGAIGRALIPPPRKEILTDLSKVEQVGQEGKQTRGLTSSEIDQDVQNKNRTLQGIGEQILATKVPESGFGFTGAVDDEDIIDIDPRTGNKLYNRTRVEDIVNKNPNHEIMYLGVKMKLIDVWNIYLDLETKSQISTTGVTPGITPGLQQEIPSHLRK